MMYKLVRNAREATAHIVEVPTEQNIFSYDMRDPNYEKLAKIFLRALNNGGGFDGWTPEFLLCQAC